MHTKTVFSILSLANKSSILLCFSTVGVKRKSQNKENSVTKPDNHTVNHEIMSGTLI